MPLFSIMIPCFNATSTLAETLASVTAQTEKDWEAIIVDDGSTDDTWAMLLARAALDPRLKVFRNPGSGPSAARNAAAAHADGDVLVFCDADDLWAPDKLSRMREVFADPGVDAAFARIAFFDARGSRTLSTVPSRALSVPTLLGENPVCTMSNVAVRASAFAATGGFDAKMVHNEDLEWLIRLVGSGFHMVGVDETLVYYRTSPTGLSANLDAMRAGREAALATAARLGFSADSRAEAIHLRYLARRALRTDAPPLQALMLALSGAVTSPAGFFSDLKRGALTLAGALAAPMMPRRLRRSLFSH